MKTLGWIVLGLMSWASTAQACFPVPMSLAQRMQAADVVYTGRVTGVRLPELERQLLGTELEQKTITASANPPRAYRVVIEAVTKGTPPERRVTEIMVSSCGGGTAALGDRVWLIQTDGHWYIESRSQ
jgi:hypothetical protein